MQTSLRSRLLSALVGFMLLLSFAEASTVQEKHVEVALRMIGHQMLLQAGDSTSLVMPVVVEEGRYRIQFVRKLGIVPNDLIEIVGDVVAKNHIATSYIIEVEQCDSNKIVYAYEVAGKDSANIIPCRGRDLPEDCYSILFTVMDEPAATLVAETDSGTSDSSWSNWVYLIILFSVFTPVAAILYFSWKKSKRLKNNPNWIALGKYQFDKLNAELILEEQRIELTSKESDLLLILYEAVNQTVEREVLLNKVWGDEGDYIGRTLDVFISKLRKKLEFDSRIKIVNVRGVGYKLVMDV